MGIDTSTQLIRPMGQDLASLFYGNEFNPDDKTTMSLLGRGGFGGQGGRNAMDIGVSNYVLGRGQEGGYVAGPNFADAFLANDTANRAATAQDSFNRWFLNGPGSAGARTQQLINSDYGGNRGAFGSEVSQMYGAVRGGGMGGGDRINPLQDVVDASNQWRSGWAQHLPNARQFQDITRTAIGDAGPRDQYGNDLRAGQFAMELNGPQMDQFGQRGVEQMRGLTNQYEQDLLRGIDEESNRSLSSLLPQLQGRLSASGVGVSGRAAGAMNSLASSVLDQANRDKMRTMSGFREANLGRMSQAINQGSQIGAEGASQSQQRMAQALRDRASMGNQNRLAEFDALNRAGMQGAGSFYDMIQRQQDSEARLREQGYQQRGAGALQGAQLDLQAILGADASNRARLGMEQQGQLAGMGQLAQLYGLQESSRRDRNNDLLTMNNNLRGLEQARLNQMLQFGMFPIQSMISMVTGLSPQDVGRQGAQQQGLGSQLLSGYLGGIANQAGGRTYTAVSDREWG